MTHILFEAISGLRNREVMEIMTYINNYWHLLSWRRQWHPTPALLPGKSHGQRSLVGCSPWGHKESDTTEQLHFHFSFPCIGEGNGNPLQCSCLENPRDGGAWWAAIYGVTQSQTRLKRLSSSSIEHLYPCALCTWFYFILRVNLGHGCEYHLVLINKENRSLRSRCPQVTRLIYGGAGIWTSELWTQSS